MTSVLFSSGGYNIGGNQLRVELRTLQGRVDTLSKGLMSMKDLLVSLNPDQAEAINKHFDDIVNPPSANTVQQPALPPPQASRPVNPAVNRVRP